MVDAGAFLPTERRLSARGMLCRIEVAQVAHPGYLRRLVVLCLCLRLRVCGGCGLRWELGWVCLSVIECREPERENDHGWSFCAAPEIRAQRTNRWTNSSPCLSEMALQPTTDVRTGETNGR